MSRNLHKRDGKMGRQARSAIYVVRTTCFLVVATGIGLAFSFWHLHETNIVVVYILAVLLAARFTNGYAYGLGAAFLATSAFNYFFTVPYFSFSVDDPAYLITFLIMTLTSLITSALTTKVKTTSKQAAEAEFLHREEKARIEKTIEQERYRGDLLRSISHDLRTPLTGIMGSSEMLMSLTEIQDQRYSLAQGIYQEADRLHSLVENILNLTKLQQGKMALHKELEAVEEVAEAAVAAMRKRAPNYKVIVNIPEDVLMVPMDSVLINQVLINLLDNAVKHSAPEQPLELKIVQEKLAGQVIFTVADFGTGIASKDLPYIFQQFYTTRGYSSDAKRGVGLGLAICASIVKAHGGKISAANRHKGHGAVFTFTLPLKEEVEDERK